MIYIFYTQTDKKINNHTFSYYYKNIPSVLQNKILKYRYWEDAQRSLLGKALLIHGLKSIGLVQYILKDLKFSKFEKPYFDDSIDFNISHSGEFVICAISLEGKIGVDIEEIKPILFTELKMFFSPKECNEIKRSADSTISFYRYWTQKEAFLKAIGMGLNIPINEAEIFNDKIKWNNKEWLLKELKLHTKYIAYLSCNIPKPELVIEEINFN